MEFTFVYQGKLKGKGNKTEKHQIRREFHKQLAVLWDQFPLKKCKAHFLTVGSSYSSIRSVGKYYFAPLVYQGIFLVAELEITILRPEEPGSIVSHGGDIDNRIKTLFDALRMPQSIAEIPEDWVQNKNERPLFCLLQDDSLVVGVSVKTDRLLVPVNHQLEVVALIKVITKATKMDGLNTMLL